MPKRKAPSGPSARARRAIAAAAPKLIEGDRVLLGLRGPAASAHALAALRQLLNLKRMDARMLQRKNEIRPFEDASSLEFLMERNGASAFLLASHTKKRPHNLVLGRTFDGHILDQLELGLEVVGAEGGKGDMEE
jgi:ribosome production factor 2